MQIKKILIAEDDQGIQEVIRTILQDNGYEILVADNKQDILQIIQESKPSLVFLDISLSGEDGVAIATEIKRNPAMKKTPIIIMSAHSDMQTLAKHAHVEGMLRKPFDIGDLLALVQKHAH